MVVLRFVFLLFIIGATVLTLAMFNRGLRRWGPYYFVESHVRNPIQTRFEMNAWQASKRKRYLEAYYDNRGWVYIIQLRDKNRKQGGQILWRKEYIHDNRGRLYMIRLTQGGWERVIRFKKRRNPFETDEEG